MGASSLAEPPAVQFGFAHWLKPTFQFASLTG